MSKIKDDYQKYLDSDEWKIKKGFILDRDEYRCRICNVSNVVELHVHHRSYQNLGKPEEVQDLITLCSDCHEIAHNIKTNRCPICGRTIKRSHCTVVCMLAKITGCRPEEVKIMDSPNSDIYENDPHSNLQYIHDPVDDPIDDPVDDPLLHENA